MGIHEDILSRITVKVDNQVLIPTFIYTYEMLPWQPGQYAKLYFYYSGDSGGNGSSGNNLEMCIDVRDHIKDQGFVTIEAGRQTLASVQLSLDGVMIVNWPVITLSQANTGVIGRVNWHIVPNCVSPICNLFVT